MTIEFQRQLFTADWHLDHRNILSPTERKFENVLEMGREFFQQLEQMVKPGDILYYLGDLTLNHKIAGEMIEQIVNVVKQVVFVFGNHDDARNVIAASKGVVWTGDIKQIKLRVTEPLATAHFGTPHTETFPCVLCHYPMRSWNGSTHGFRHLHGHSHGKAREWRNALDVGIDNAYKLLGAYRPFTADEVREQIDRINKEVKFEGRKD